MENKIRLITFHTPRNYGAVLQAYSLSEYLVKYSEDVKVIDYDTEHLRSFYPIIPPIRKGKDIVRNALYAYRFPAIHRKQDKFTEFVEKKFSKTKKFTSTRALYDYDWNGCTFVTGSDQVFNPNRIEDERKAFFLDFTPAQSKRIAYAASFGVKKIPEDKQEEIREYLMRFSKLAVREKSGQALIERLTGLKSTVVLDPVFLHDLDFWTKMGKPYHREFGEYLFYYNLMESRDSDTVARNIADEKGLKLVVITEGTIHVQADAILRDVGPEEFLYLMSHAAFIVTDSFHGVAFSLILKKQFVFSDEKKIINSRGLELLDSFQLKSIAYSKNYSSDKSIDYKEVDSKLMRYVQSARQYLDNVFKTSTGEI